MPPKKRQAAAAVAAPAKRATTHRRAAREDTVPSDPAPPPADDPVALVTALRLQMELQNADLAAEMANFDVTIQSTSQRLDELTAVMQEIRQALSPGAINFAGTPRPPANPSPAASDDVLSQWHWMTRPLVESIANGTFDIYDLPKLHRDQTLRDRHIQKNVEGVLQPLSGGKPILLHAKTKLQSTFPDLHTFLSAWLIYGSIRTAFAPERGPGLWAWTERIVGFGKLQYEFVAILDYIVAYFQKHQRSPPEKWFEMDSELHTEHLGNAAQKALTKSASLSSPTKAAAPKATPAQTGPSKPVTDQVCHAWNRSAGCQIKERTGNPCLRRHVCRHCMDPGHTSLACTKSQ